MSSAAVQQPTPQLFLQTINSYQRTEALKAAIELNVFTAVGEGKETAAPKGCDRVKRFHGSWGRKGNCRRDCPPFGHVGARYAHSLRLSNHFGLPHKGRATLWADAGFSPLPRPSVSGLYRRHYRVSTVAATKTGIRQLR